MDAARRRKGSGASNAGVLRAGDIIPPFDAPAKQQGDAGSNIAAAGGEPGHPIDPTPRPVSGDDSARRSSDAGSEGDDIPRFDLADEIMAEHRRMVGARRAGPRRKQESPSQVEARQRSARGVGSMIFLQPPQRQRVITEIVCRDLAGWVRGSD